MDFGCDGVEQGLGSGGEFACKITVVVVELESHENALLAAAELEPQNEILEEVLWRRELAGSGGVLNLVVGQVPLGF